MSYKKIILLSFFFYATFTCATAQVNVLTTKLVCKGDSATWTMRFFVEEGFYVFAPDNLNDGGASIPMNITWIGIPDKLQPVGKLIWPVATFHETNRVFTEGEHEVQQVFIVTNKRKIVSSTIKGKILFQGCREDQCFPPNETVFETKL